MGDQSLSLLRLTRCPSSSTPPVSSRDRSELASTTVFSLSDTALTVTMSTGSSRTPGDQAGVKPDTFVSARTAPRTDLLGSAVLHLREQPVRGFHTRRARRCRKGQDFCSFCSVPSAKDPLYQNTASSCPLLTLTSCCCLTPSKQVLLSAAMRRTQIFPLVRRTACFNNHFIKRDNQVIYEHHLAHVIIRRRKRR